MQVSLRKLGISDQIPNVLKTVDKEGNYEFNLIKEQTYDVSVVKNGYCFNKDKVRVSPTIYEKPRVDFVMTGKEITYSSDHTVKVALEHLETKKIVYKELKRGQNMVFCANRPGAWKLSL